MIRAPLIAAINAAVLIAACGQQQSSSYEPSPRAAAAQTASAPTSMNEAAFAQFVVTTDAFDIEAAELAAERAGRAEVRDLAAALARDHAATTRELAALAPRLGLAAPEAAFDVEHLQKLDTLRTLSGAAFDDLYLDQQVDAHEAAVRSFASYAQSAPAGPLRDWAQATLPKLHAHLASVQALENAS